MSEQQYPGVFERIKAMVIDSVVVIFLMFLATYTFSLFDNVPDFVRITAMILIFLLYEPLFTTFSGGTVGHKSNGIRVRRSSDEKKNIMLHSAIFRFLIKSFLGIFSLLFVYNNPKRKAIHDYLAGSVVVYETPQ